MQEKRRARTAARITLLVAVSLLISIAACAQYTDDFTSAPTFSNGNKKAETGTAVEGLAYETSDSTFSHVAGKLSVLADVVGPGSLTIESRDGNDFIFYELWIDNFVDDVTMTGTGPEPFTTNVPQGTYGDVGPGGVGKLVSRVTLSSTLDLDIFIDNVDVEFGDSTKPDVTIDQAGGQADPTNGSPVTFTVVFNEPINEATFTNADVSVGGTATTGTVTVTEVAPNDDTTYEVSIAVSADGTVMPTIPAGGVADPAGNTNEASTSTDNSVTYDATDPTDPTPTSSSHTVSVWDNDNTIDISISGAADTGSGVDGFEIEWDQSATWTPTETKEQEENWSGATFTATSNGNWYFHVATVDNAGNWTSTQHLGPFWIDTADPSVPTGLDPANGSYTNDTSPVLSWDASTDSGGSGIRTADAYRIVVTGPVNRDTYVSDTDYNPTLSEGTFTWKVYARDNAGNSSSYTADTTLIIDATQPDVTINQAGGQADPTTASPVVFTVAFDEPIDEATFTTIDVSVAGPGTVGTITEVAPNDDTTFSVSVDMTGDGTVTATIPAGGIADFAGNTNTLSTSTDNSVTYDGSKPNVTIDRAVGQAELTNAFPVTFTAVFDEPINTGTFTAGDVSLGGTYLVAQVTGISEIAPNDGTTFSITVNVLVHLNDGTIILTIPAGGVEDLIGNTNNASTSTNNIVTMDTDPPAPTSVSPNAAYDADVGVVSVSITFDEPMDTGTNPSPTITGLATPYTITGSAWSNGDQTWTGSFTLVDDNELATGDYNVSGFKDVAGNSMVPDSSKSIEVDTENPSVLTVDVTDAVIRDSDHGGAFSVTVVFDQSMNTGAVPSIVFDPDLTAGTFTAGATGWSQTTVVDDTYTLDYTIADVNVDADSVLVDVTGAEDGHGNEQLDYTPLNEFQVDTLNPTVTSLGLSHTWIDDRDVGGDFVLTITYSEIVSTKNLPVVTFTPDVASTLTTPSYVWTDTRTCEIAYDVLDANIVVLDVDISIDGVVDFYGNAQIPFNTADAFDIDTLNPPPGTQWLFVDPTGSAGPDAFLDRCVEVPEGDEPPMAGACELSAVYEVGELVTGGCNVCDADGSIMRGSGVHIWVYSVNIDVRPEVDTLLDHWTVHYDVRCGAYAFDWDTTGYAPGIYDMRLGFEDESSVNIRVELVEPAE